MRGIEAPSQKFGFDWKDPWEVSFATLLTETEEYLRSGRTGRSSSGMVIIDHDDRYLDVVRLQSKERRLAPGWRRTRKVIEIGYSAASHANPLIQLTDLVAFTMKKWTESNTDFGAEWSSDAHLFFERCHDLVWPRVEFKMLRFNALNVPVAMTDYVKGARRLGAASPRAA